MPQWVVWRGVERNGRTTKPPRQIDGRPAKANDPWTWTTFENVLEAYEAGEADGIGFMFASGGGLVGIDLDGCTEEDGTVQPLGVNNRYFNVSYYRTFSSDCHQS